MDLSQHYQLPFFDANGFQRKRCPSCDMHFWTLDPDTELCGDPPCVEYSFIGSPITDKAFDLAGMRERFLGYMEANGHERVRRQPVAARWRDDIYLNIASISNYQPHVTGGQIPPPANPLTVSQPCIRLNDLDSVGRSGRHLTQFEMMAHHCFNYPKGHRFAPKEAAGLDKLYFKDHTVELCHGLLDALGIDETSVTYKENPWAGGGNAGPAFEVLTHGLELATLVFMQWETDPQGEIQVKGDTYSEMDLQIVDTGYGLERFVWASQGTPTIYEAVVPHAVEKLSEEVDLAVRQDPAFAPILAEHAKLSCILDVDTGQKLRALRQEVAQRLGERGIDVTADELGRRLAPLEAVYAVADHTRCLTFMLGDGIVPSNVRAGYLARLLIRKSLRLLQSIDAEIPLYEIVRTHLEELRDDYPELWEARRTMEEVLELETDRFNETLARGRRLVQREVKDLDDGKGLGIPRLVELYDSHGMPPEIVQDVAQDAGVEIDVPDDFYARVADLHSTETLEEETEQAPPDLPSTERLYYQEATAKDFNATVLWSEQIPEDEREAHAVADDDPPSHRVILDQTCFYPEGGGQPADQGFLFVREETRRVIDVQSWGELIVHHLDGPIKVGEAVRGQIDWGRRQALTKNHTATHIIGGAARSVLGGHVWQSGAQKGTERSRLDVTHYQRISDEELREMETLANLMVLEGRPVEKVWMDRVEAEKKYGFILYQGGVPPGDDIRVVRIPEFDVQACGGTHAGTTGELGLIKIFRTERIQDGVERIEFAAGLSALREIQSREDILKASAETFDVPIEELPRTSQRFFDEWKAYRKEADELRKTVAKQRLGSLREEAETVGEIELVVARVDIDLDDLVTAVGELIEQPGTVAIVGGIHEGNAGLVAARSSDVDLDARELSQAGGRKLGGGGGGSPELARAGGPEADNIDEALAAAGEAAREQLGS